MLTNKLNPKIKMTEKWRPVPKRDIRKKDPKQEIKEKIKKDELKMQTLIDDYKMEWDHCLSRSSSNKYENINFVNLHLWYFILTCPN